jgi:hypothetical protein
MTIDTLIIIFQADRKTHEEFPKGINKIPPNKKKRQRYIFLLRKNRILGQ